MSDEHPAARDDERVDIDDPFEVPEEVEDAWESEDGEDGEAPSG